MRLPRECYQLKQVIETHLPHLSPTQLTGLTWWVCGAILAGSACQNAVASALSPRGSWNNLRQYLREWLYDGRPGQSLQDRTGRKSLLRAAAPVGPASGFVTKKMTETPAPFQASFRTNFSRYIPLGGADRGLERRSRAQRPRARRPWSRSREGPVRLRSPVLLWV